MSNCIYCGNKLPLLSFKLCHKECEVSNQLGKQTITSTTLDAIKSDGDDLLQLKTKLDNIAKEHYVNNIDRKNCIINAYDLAVAFFNEDSVITKEEEAKLVIFQEQFYLTQEDLNKTRAFDLVAKSSIVRRLAAGEQVEIGTGDMQLPIILGRDERLLWGFGNTILYQPSTKTTYQGSSQGVSLRIASGVYYRMGAFKGNPITTSELKEVATGLTFYTNKNLFFSSAIKAVKIPLDKIINITLYEDGVSIQKDGTSIKPFIFKNIDGEFLQNIIANLKGS